MPKALIKLAWRQVIDINSNTPFEQDIFNTTFAEFIFQQQSFSKGEELYTWSAIRSKFPKAHPALPFKVSFSIAGLLQSLDKKIPDLEDTLSLRPIHFFNHYFQLIESDIRDHSVHKVAVIYFTDTLTYFGNIGDALLLTDGDAAHTPEHQPISTFQLRADPRLSIFSYVELQSPSVRTSPARPSALPA